MPTTGRALRMGAGQRYARLLLGTPLALDQGDTAGRIGREQLFGGWVAPQIVTRNVLLADGFEPGVAGGWTPTSATLAQDTTTWYSGAASAKLTVTGSPTQALARYSLTARPGRAYRVQMWAMAPAGAASAQAAIDWYSGGLTGTYLSTVTSPATALAAGVWTALDCSAVAPDSAVRLDIGPTIGANPATGAVLNFDVVSVTEKVISSPLVIPFDWLSAPTGMRPDPPVNTVTVGLSGGRGDVRLTNQASIAQYGQWANDSVTLDAQSAEPARVLATYLATFYGDRRQRVAKLAVDLLPLTDQERWTVLGVGEGQRITISGTPATWPWTGADLVVEGVAQEFSATTRRVVWSTSPLIGAYPGVSGPWFQLDSSVLGGTDLLPY